MQSPRHSNSGVLPDLLPPHTPPQSRSPPMPQRPQDKSTSEEVKSFTLFETLKKYSLIKEVNVS